MKNDKKLELLWEELDAWMQGNDYDGNLEFAFNNNFQLHALSIWYGSGASKYSFPIKINRKQEEREIKELLSIAYLLHCKDCNHIGFYDEFYIPETGSTCQSCNNNNTQLEEPKELKNDTQ